MKTCTKCGETKEFSEFYTSKNAKDGHSSSCKKCAKLRYEQKKVDIVLQVSGAIRSSILIENKILKSEGKRICSICKNIHPKENMVAINYCKPCYSKKRKEYRRQTREENKEKIREYTKKYRELNKDRLKENHAIWRQKKKLEKLQALEAQNDNSI